MIDNLGLLLSHGLIALVAWRLLFRDDLDSEAPPVRPRRFGARAEPAPSGDEDSAGA